MMDPAQTFDIEVEVGAKGPWSGREHGGGMFGARPRVSLAGETLRIEGDGASLEWTTGELAKVLAKGDRLRIGYDDWGHKLSVLRGGKPLIAFGAAKVAGIELPPGERDEFLLVAGKPLRAGETAEHDGAKVRLVSMKSLAGYDEGASWSYSLLLWSKPLDERQATAIDGALRRSW